MISLLTAIRYVLFYVLMWLRILVHPATTFCTAIGLLGIVLMAVVHPDHHIMWKLAGFSFASFVIGWLYDGLLLVVSPRSIML